MDQAVVLRNLSEEQRLKQALQLSDFVRTLSRAGTYSVNKRRAYNKAKHKRS